MLNNETLVKQLFETTVKSLEVISKETGNKTWKVQQWVHLTYTPEEIYNRKIKVYSLSKQAEKNPMKGKCGERHHNFIGDVSDGKGYLMRVKPDWYTGRKGCKHVFVHHIVMCEHLGLTEIPKGFCVHHLDGDKTNNDISNLELMSISAHARLHLLERATTSRKA